MPDVFDEVSPDTATAERPAQADVFDAVAPSGDVFDQVAPESPRELTPAQVAAISRDARQRGVPGIGPFGPNADAQQAAEELKALIMAPAEVAAAVTEPISDMAADFLRRSGIAPNAQAGQPTIELPPSTNPIPAVRGAANALLKTVEGFTEPGQLAMLPFAGLKPVQLGFQAQIASQIPEAALRVIQAQTPEERGAAVAGLGINALMAHALARVGAERVSQKVTKETKIEGIPAEGTPALQVSEFGGLADLARQQEKGTSDATTIRTQPEGNQPEHPRAPSGATVRANEAEVREGNGGPTGGGGSNAPGGTQPATATPEPLPEPSAGSEGVPRDVGAGARPPSQGLRILAAGMNEALGKRAPIPQAWVEEFNNRASAPFALPEGYRLEGDQWVYHEPAGPGGRPTFAELADGIGKAATVEELDQANAAVDSAHQTGELTNQEQNALAMMGMRRGRELQPPETEAQNPEARPEPTARVEQGTPGMPIGERPPDILDEIEAVTSGGVRVSSKADYGEYLQRATGRAKELLSMTKGLPANEVIRHLQDAGFRVGTEDELLDAMVRAGEARKGWREQARETAEASATAEPTAEDPWAETIARLNALGDEDLAVGQEPGKAGFIAGSKAEAWADEVLSGGATHAGPDVLAAYVVKGAALIERGVRTFAEWSAEMVRQYGEQIRPQLQRLYAEAAARAGVGLRATGEKILGSEAVSSPTKDAVTEYLYQQRSNATDEQTAAGILQRAGLDQAEQAVVNPPAAMPGAVRSKLLGAVTRELALQEKVARGKGDAAAADALAKRQGRLWDNVLPQITDLAQSLQALRDIIDMSPEGHVARVRAGLERKAQEAVDGRRPEVEVMRGALEEGQKDGVAVVRQDPAVNEAARAAVNEQVANSSETHRAVIMDLAEGWSESPVVVAQARALVRSRAEQLLGRQVVPIGRSAPEVLRGILDDLGKRAATIAADYFQGAATHKDGLTGLYKERLGLEEGKARQLAARMEAEFQRQVTIAKNKLPQRIATARVAQQRGAGVLDLNAPGAAVERAIRRQLGELNLKLGEVLQQEAGRQEQTAQHVAERIVQASGLQGEAADTLRTTLRQRWDALVTDAQRRRLEALQRVTGTQVRGPMKDAFTKLAELNRLGALSNDRFYDVVKKALKLKELTDADAKQLKALVERAQEQPEGFLRERAAADVLSATQRLSGNQSWWDVPMAIWYTNAVSGLTTYAKIPFENTNMFAGNLMSGLLSRPGEVLRPVSFARATAGALKRGLAKGALQAESTLRTGTVTGVWERPRTNLLEQKPFGSKLDVLNFWKYLARLTSTMHEGTFKPAWEFKQTMLARDVATREGLKGRQLEQRVADLMANTEQAVASARGQAIAELTALGRLKERGAGESAAAYAGRAWGDKLDLARRTREILEQQREANMPGSTAIARDYALRTAYLNEPYGVMGVIANGVNAMLRQLRLQAPVTGTLAKAQIPFVRVASNILNEAWNWGPGGLQRAALSHWTGKLYGRPIREPRERAEMYAKGIVGTVALGTLAALAGDKIHGNGPADPNKRRQLLAQGWIPNSVQIGGRFISYDKSPMKFWLATLGNYQDWLRYGKGDEADGATRLAFVTKATANTMLNQSMLESVKRAIEAFGDENTGGGAKKMEQALARTGATFVTPNLVQQLDRMWDPTVYDKTGVGALVASQVPFVRRGNKPILNVLGEPVQSGPFHFWASQQSQDPVWRLLAEKGAFVPEPSKATIIGSRAAGPGYFRAITPDEYYDLVQQSGKAIRSDLSQNLSYYQALTPKQLQAAVQAIAEARHEEAKMMIVQRSGFPRPETAVNR